MSEVDEFGNVYYKGSVMVEVGPYERCPIKVGILINNQVRFFRYGLPKPVICLSEMFSQLNYSSAPLDAEDVISFVNLGDY